MTITPPPTSGMRLAAIGLGRMGVRHLEAVRKLGMDVVGVSDPVPSTLAQQATALDVPATGRFSDASAMLQVTKPEAVVIATTAPSHAALTIAAARAGAKFILCEKPMAVSLAEADAMIAACEEAGARLAINHQMQFMTQYTEVKKLAVTPELGGLTSILVAGSNFGLAMNACHYFEMFRFVTGRRIESVSAWLEDDILPNPRGPQFEDRSGRVLVRSSGGPTMFMDLSCASGHGVNVTYICRYGQIQVDELSGRMRVIHRKAEFRDLPTTRYGMPADLIERDIEPADVVGPTIRVWQAMVGGQPYPDESCGLHALTALVAAHASHESGGVAVVLSDPKLPRQRVFKWA